jgi:hypothetical protein
LGKDFSGLGEQLQSSSQHWHDKEYAKPTWGKLLKKSRQNHDNSALDPVTAAKMIPPPGTILILYKARFCGLCCFWRPPPGNHCSIPLIPLIARLLVLLKRYHQQVQGAGYER